MKRAPALTHPTTVDAEGIISALRAKELGIPSMCSGGDDFKRLIIIADAQTYALNPYLAIRLPT